MKHSLKICSLTIFAATVASAITSCGNESELFDEPVMYQTRAMTRADMGGEGERRYITTNGPSKGSYHLREGEAHLEVTFDWNSGYEEENHYSVSPYPVLIDDNPNNEGLYVYIYEEKEKPYISNGPYLIKQKFDEYLAVNIKGTIYEYRYNRIEGKFDDTVKYEIQSHQCIAKNPLGVELRSKTVTLSKPIINTPIELTDSLTIQKQ